MRKFFELKVDYGYDMNTVGYYDNYADAFNTANDFIFHDKLEGLRTSYLIIERTANIEYRYSPYIVYSCYDIDKREWIHSDLPLVNKNVWELSYDRRIKEWSKEFPMVTSKSNSLEIHNVIANNNQTVIEEIAGYREFCKRTLENYRKTMYTPTVIETPQPDCVYTLSTNSTSFGGTILGYYPDYCSAYNAAIDRLIDESISRTWMGWYHINKIKFPNTKILISAYSSFTEQWTHYDINEANYNGISYRSKVREWKASGWLEHINDRNVFDVIEANNNAILEEQVGYKEFCKRTKYTNTI